MPDLDPEVGALLREYLISEKEKDGWRGDLRMRMDRLWEQAVKTERQVDSGFLSVNMRIDGLDARIETLEEADEITEVQNREQLLGKLKEERAKKEGLQKWILGVVAVLLAALITSGTALAFQTLKNPVLPAKVPAPKPELSRPAD